MIADRLDINATGLPAPERQANGSMIYHAVLATPGVMDYPDGSTLVPDATLADRAWLDSLAGMPVISDDAETHHHGTNPEKNETVAVGTVLRADWDSIGKRVLAKIVIDTQKGIDAVASGVIGVSPAYRADIEERSGLDTSSGLRYTRVQVRRYASDNVAITRTPRGGPKTIIRADSMTDEQITSFEASISKLAEGQSAISKQLGEFLESIKPKAKDDDEPTVDSLLSTARLLDAAKANGIKIDADSTLDSVRAAIIGKILPGRTGLSADAIDVAIEMSATKPVKSVSIAAVNNSIPSYLGGAK